MHRAQGEQRAARATVSDFIQRVGRAIAESIDTELERTGLDRGTAEAWGHALVGMVQVAGDWWLQEGRTSRTVFVEQLVALAWDGLSVLGGESQDPATQ